MSSYWDSWYGGDSGPQLTAHQTLGQKFLISLFALLRSAGLYDVNNRALDRPATELREAAHDLFRLEGTLRIVAQDGQFSICDRRIQIPANKYHFVRGLEEILTSRNVSGVQILRPPTTPEVKRFAHLFKNLPASIIGAELVNQALSKAGVDPLSVLPRVKVRLEGGEPTAGEGGTPEVRATLTYARGLGALEQLLSDPAGKEKVTTRNLRRVVQRIADCAGETLDYLIGLTELSKENAHLSRVAIDLCVVSVALGRSLFLDRARISDLGMTALSLFQTRRGGNGPVRDPVRQPLTALLDLLDEGVWNGSTLRRVLAVAQRGQPVRGTTGQPDQRPLSRIIRAAFDFVAMTHGIGTQDGSPTARLTAQEALTRIVTSPPHVYDAVVVEHLVRVVGPYPVGTAVILETGERAFVVGRDPLGYPMLRCALSNGTFGKRLVADGGVIRIVAVLENPDPAERTRALLSETQQRAILAAAQAVKDEAHLARISLQRIVIRQPDED